MGFVLSLVEMWVKPFSLQKVFLSHMKNTAGDCPKHSAEGWGLSWAFRRQNIHSAAEITCFCWAFQLLRQPHHQKLLNLCLSKLKSSRSTFMAPVCHPQIFVFLHFAYLISKKKKKTSSLGPHAGCIFSDTEISIGGFRENFWKMSGATDSDMSNLTHSSFGTKLSFQELCSVMIYTVSSLQLKRIMFCIYMVLESWWTLQFCYSHSHSYNASVCSILSIIHHPYIAWTSSSLGFSILLKVTYACRSETGIEPLTFWLVDESLCFFLSLNMTKL